jgi:hypothetical protein
LQPDEEKKMGWTISVGRAGAAKGNGVAQVMAMRVDEPGVVLRLKVGGNGTASGGAPAPAWQAQRVWQKVLATVVGID